MKERQKRSNIYGGRGRKKQTRGNFIMERGTERHGERGWAKEVPKRSYKGKTVEEEHIRTEEQKEKN